MTVVPGPVSDARRTAEHWAEIWAEDDDERSWHQPDVTGSPSLRLVRRFSAPGASVVDVGGGSSPLVDALLDRGHPDPIVVDVTDRALAHGRDRLGERGRQVRWVVADVRELDLGAAVDVWHDRAVLHFLVDEEDRAAYVEALRRHLRVGGHAVIGVFAPDGPTTCSGLPVRRYDPGDLLATLGDGFTLVHDEVEAHRTPGGDEQPFTWAVLRRDS